MKGNRKNYGKRANCLRITLRLYDEDRKYIELLAILSKISTADAILEIIHMDRWDKDWITK